VDIRLHGDDNRSSLEILVDEVTVRGAQETEVDMLAR
jgi:hypothetical protein